MPASMPPSPGAASPTRIRRVRPLVSLVLVALAGTAGLAVATASMPESLRVVGSIALFASAATAATWAIHARGDLAHALAEKERAISSLRWSAEMAAASEARLQLLFDSAVDGVLELDHDQKVVRANEAFCKMLRQPQSSVVGRPWAEIAAESERKGHSLAGLLLTHEAVLKVGDDTRYLEARSSPLATVPPGSLLVVRDVTASRVAEQTIRTLFKFLQDRDEDRTRLLQRTNAAIEAERNRIARDLHDGPIQGVTGATLSLEAARMMIDAGDYTRAYEMLKRVQEELEEEADSLRSVLSDLRPPVLEERGLVPALRELCQRFEREREIPVSIRTGPYNHVPPEVETLAYRVAQEALSNVSKHARASHVDVRVETGLGTLTIEVEDDGCGFDPLTARDFLRLGKVGLASMRERAELGGGMLVVQSRPESGTTISATLPFDMLAGAPRPE